jgi:sugar transferase EpsL
MAFGGLVVLAPVLLGIALAIRLTMGAPILFRQERPGLHGHPFTILKFRSMTVARDRRDELLNSDKRVTRLGAFLRRTSLDELPELWNVVRGDMSLVGPRPLLMEYLPHYSAAQARRHEMRPGITGLAQVRGRNDMGWDKRFRLDTWYVDHWSMRLDARIILDTLRVILDGQGTPDPSSLHYWFAGVDTADSDPGATAAASRT